jgi:hypothetical protein
MGTCGGPSRRKLGGIISADTAHGFTAGVAPPGAQKVIFELAPDGRRVVQALSDDSYLFYASQRVMRVYFGRGPHEWRLGHPEKSSGSRD